ncbi:MAG: glycine cleavage system aminomethyltransferase GcvT, partial [Bdellovibrionales bacterium]|nr:glycine cleavage system aminomethyltransferase GcvT [Bdellovibrionales bacterium]
MRITPLNQSHKDLGAKMVEFAGWEMPIQYRGVREEHDCVRKDVGLFDVSHMGEIRFKGPKALESLQWLTSNDVSKLNDGKAHYSLLTNETGGIVDDIIVYCLKQNSDYLVCVNAANIEKDFKWMLAHNKGADVTNESDRWGQIAVQGPKSLDLGAKIFGSNLLDLAYFSFAPFEFGSSTVYVARTGYTGEKGFEVFVPAEATAALWSEFLEKGSDLGVQPIGLAARDTLRTEMKYSLYGHEISDTTNPYEAELGWVVKPKKGEFVGKGPILAGKEAGITKKLVGFKMLEKGIPRQGYLLKNESGGEIGVVTSGTMSPSLGEPIGIGYVSSEFGEVGAQFLVEIRGKTFKAHVVKTPF